MNPDTRPLAPGESVELRRSGVTYIVTCDVCRISSEPVHGDGFLAEVVPQLEAVGWRWHEPMALWYCKACTWPLQGE